MKEPKFNLLSAVFISLSVLIGSLWIGYSIQESSKSNDYAYLSKSLITQEEAAHYLSLSPEVFDELVLNDSIERSKYNVYDTYKYLPYIYVNEDRYFNPESLDLWVEYNGFNHTRFKIK